MIKDKDSLWRVKKFLPMRMIKWCAYCTRMTPALLLVVVMLCGASGATQTADGARQFQGTRALAQPNFCAMILRIYGTGGPSIRIYALMEPEQVTEENLRGLFQVISDTYPKASLLQVSVYTDVRQLGFLAAEFVASGPDNPAQTTEDSTARGTEAGSNNSQDKLTKYQWAYYVRGRTSELFRYNPNYPNPGTKTIILRGKE